MLFEELKRTEEGLVSIFDTQLLNPGCCSTGKVRSSGPNVQKSVEITLYVVIIIIIIIIIM
jgi:hypothetical protein